jgi:hypothetical protein
MTAPAKKISQAAAGPEPKNDDASGGVSPAVEEELDAELQEFRTLRRDLDASKALAPPVSAERSRRESARDMLPSPRHSSRSRKRDGGEAS